MRHNPSHPFIDLFQKILFYSRRKLNIKNNWSDMKLQVMQKKIFEGLGLGSFFFDLFFVT